MTMERFIESCLRRRALVVIALAVSTLLMAALGLGVKVKTVFSDLLPKSHPYVAVNDEFKQSFGGSSVVSIMLRVDRGDIFTVETLKKIQNITNGLREVEGVNSLQITSLASRKLKEIRSSTDGIETRPLMWPSVPANEDEVKRLRESVLNNLLVYGNYVSLDLKSALITADFYDQQLDYAKVFSQVMVLADEAQGAGVSVHVVGEPILYGWVSHYVPETLRLLVFTLLGLAALLFLITRTWRGTLLPLLAGLVSAIWALGAARLLGYHLDPLVIVVAFLITARSISHSVQLVTKFDDEVNAGATSTRAAAKASMLALFKPGMLGVVADAGCMLVVVLTPIPLLEKVAVIGTVWVCTIAISAVILTPIALSWISNPHRVAHPIDLSVLMDPLLRVCARVVETRWRYAVLAIASVLFVASGLYAFKLKVGDANPGSPILWPTARYNIDSRAINEQFAGADRMFVVFSGKKADAAKQPEVLTSMRRFQRFMEAQPEVGGTLSIADVLPFLKRIVREDNPRYQELGADAGENGELLYLLASGSDPGDIEHFVDKQSRNASVTLYFRDHQGETIRTAVARVKEFAAREPSATYDILLAGGLVGVLAAANEVILAGQIESIALALLVLVICCAVTYKSMVAGVFFMVPVMLSNTLTFSYMALNGIGMNVNTLPIAALGIGLGVDYSFYIVDGIREELRRGRDILDAISSSLMSAGRGVLITAAALIFSVVLWLASSLRFQAEMGLLMALWLFISAVSALFLMPVLVYVFRPKFVVEPLSRQMDLALQAP
jgi:predicted RND superfamily exporter protein